MRQALEEDSAVETQSATRPTSFPAEFVVRQLLSSVGRSDRAAVDATRTEAGGPSGVKQLARYRAPTDIQLVSQARAPGVCLNVVAGAVCAIEARGADNAQRFAYFRADGVVPEKADHLVVVTVGPQAPGDGDRGSHVISGFGKGSVVAVGAELDVRVVHAWVASHGLARGEAVYEVEVFPVVGLALVEQAAD